MENLVRQADGTYALAFRNYNKLLDDEVMDIFQKYGEVSSIRKSQGAIQWVFVRYKTYEEAFDAYNSLQNCRRFEIRVATSGRKSLEQGCDEKEKEAKGDTREKGNARASNTRNSFVRSSPKEDDFSNDMEGARSLPQKIQPNRRKNPNVSDNEDEKDAVETIGSNLKKLSLVHGNIKHKKVNNEEIERDNSSSSRVIKRSGSYSRSDSRLHPNHIAEEGPPKLMRATEFYASLTLQHPYESGLAYRAVFNEVWTNHPLRNEMELKEVVLTNFDYVPTKREIVKLCSGVRLLHISIALTPKKMPYCRVLVATEDDAEKLYELDGCDYNGSQLYVSSLEYILDEMAE